MLHVLQVTGAMNRGGAEVMLMDLYRNVSADVKFDFLINYKTNQPQGHGDYDGEINQMGGRLRYIGTQWDLGIFKYISEFKKIVQDIGKPDVVHIHLNSRGGGIALAARLCGIKKIIVHNHDILLFNRKSLRGLLEIAELKLQKLLVALFATDFWGCSEAAITSLFFKWHIVRGNTLTINNAINISVFQGVHNDLTMNLRATYGVSADTIIIGNVGRIIRRKNIGHMNEVIKVLNEKGIDFLFVFAGRIDDADYFEELMHQARDFNLADRMLHLGDRCDIPVILSTFDVFVAPNQNEGFGMVALEAQASSLPCILSKGFTTSIDMDLGLVTFVDNYDPSKWATEILEAVDVKRPDAQTVVRAFTERGFDSFGNAQHIERLYRS